MNLWMLDWRDKMGRWKDGKKVNVLCIVNRDHQRSAVAVDHPRNCKCI